MAYGISGSVDGDFELFIYDATSGDLLKRKTLSGVTEYTEYVSNNSLTVNVVAVPADTSKQAITYNNVDLTTGIVYDSDLWFTINIPVGVEPPELRGPRMVSYDGKIYMIGGRKYDNTYMADFWIWDSATNTWEQQDDFPDGGLYYHSLVEYNGKLYVYGGNGESGANNDVWEYNIATETWTEKTAGGGTGGRYGHIAGVIGSKMYIAGGWTTTQARSADTYEYDLIGDSWTQKANQAGRYLPGSAVWDGKFYMFGGRDQNSNYSNDVYAYDPVGNSWTQKLDMLVSSQATTVAVHGDFAYAFGGYLAGVYQDDTQRYNFNTNSWSQRADLDFTFAYATAATINDTIYVFGGADTVTALKNFNQLLRYNPTDNLHTLPEIEDDVTKVATGMVGDKFYLIGGYAPAGNVTEYKKVYEYDISANTWTRKKDITWLTGTGYNSLSARFGCGYATYNSKIYVFGGSNNANGNTANAYVYYNEMYEYTPATDSWVTKLAGGTAVYMPTMVNYNDKMYIHGGTTNVANGITSLYEYDITNNTWDTKAVGPAMWAHSSAVYNGKIYAYGGYDGTGTITNDMWEYNIGTNTWTQKADGPVSMTGQKSFAHGGKIYIVCGRNSTSTYLDDVYVYDIDTNTWDSAATSLIGAGRYYHALEKYNGKVYVYGGQTTSSRLTDFYEYII